MKATNGETCCVCDASATDRNFAGDGFCPEHLMSWQEFSKRPHISLENAFRVWLEREQSQQEATR